MSIQIVESSPAALAIIEKKEFKKKDSIYPFNQLNVGQSFTVPMAECNLQSIRVIAGRKSKNDKMFTVVVHADLEIVEVARRS